MKGQIIKLGGNILIKGEATLKELEYCMGDLLPYDVEIKNGIVSFQTKMSVI